MNAYERTIGREEHPLMTALGRGLPISLLVDVIDPNGDRARSKCSTEKASQRTTKSAALPARPPARLELSPSSADCREVRVLHRLVSSRLTRR